MRRRLRLCLEQLGRAWWLQGGATGNFSPSCGGSCSRRCSVPAQFWSEEFLELKAGHGLVLDGVVDRDPRLFSDAASAVPKLRLRPGGRRTGVRDPAMQAGRCVLDPSRRPALSVRRTASLAAGCRLSSSSKHGSFSPRLDGIGPKDTSRACRELALLSALFRSLTAR